MGVFEDHRKCRIVKTLAYLFMLAVIYVPIFFVLFVKHNLSCKAQTISKKNITIVITGAKMYKSTLFVKWLGKAGYDIVLVETEKFWCSGSRFSKYVTKFCTISDALTKPEQYVKDLVKICKDNNAKIFIPVCAPATEKLDSIVGQKVESFGVQVLHAPISIFDKLNNKQQFGDYMTEIGLAVPEAFLVESDLGVFQINTILKKRIKEGGENER